MEIHDYNVVQTAEQQGMGKGIRAAVSVLHSANASQPKAAKHLAALFDIFPKTAEEVDPFLRPVVTSGA